MRQQRTITLKAVLDVLDTDTAFSMAWVTDDEKRGTGGEWIEVKEARKHNWISKQDKERLAKAQPKDQRVSKNPHHFENSTRNIILPNGEIRTVAIRLIRRFDKPGIENLFTNGRIVT